MILSKEAFIARVLKDKKEKELKKERDIQGCFARRCTQAKMLNRYYRCH